MSAIPRPALWLGLAGLLPFLYGAGVAAGAWPPALPALGAAVVLGAYGAAILAFMGGCLWGFAVAGGRQPTGRELGLAVVPALWAFAAGFHPTPLLSLALGFVVLLAIDAMFALKRLTPPWWMVLRVPLTLVVLACLAMGIMA